VKRSLLDLAIAALIALIFAAPAAAASRPKVRAITAFIHLDRENYREQVAEALQMLRQMKAEIEKAGYKVESVRITTQPFPEYTHGLSRQQALDFFRDYDALAIKEGFDPNIGPAMMNDSDDPTQAELLAEVLSMTKTLESSIIVAGEDGVHWKAIRCTARLVKYVEAHSLHSQGNFNFTATAMLAPYAPFFPGSYHTGAGHGFAIGMESANVVAEVFSRAAGDALRAQRELTAALSEHSVAIEKIAQRVAKETGWRYMGFDPTPAPLKDVSIGGAIENFTGAKLGSPGTLTAVSIITAAVRDVPVQQIGYRGLMLPVLEDSVIAERWSEGRVNADSLLSYSSVCGTGMDTIPLPGDVSEEQLARMIGDVASLAFKWHKPLSARLQPVAGKRAGEKTEFDDPFLVNATLQPVP